jgi:hypothetical protein
MDFGKIFEAYGFYGLVTGSLFFMIWRWSLWIMGWIRDRDRQQAEERTSWLCRIEKISDLTNKISSSIDDHDKRADERGKYVRDEHKQMIEILGRINGYRKDV